MVAASHAAFFSQYSAMDWRAASPHDPDPDLYPSADQLTFEEVMVATGASSLRAAAFAGVLPAARPTVQLLPA